MVFAEEAGLKPTAGLLCVVIEGLQPDIRQMALYEERMLEGKFPRNVSSLREAIPLV